MASHDTAIWVPGRKDLTLSPMARFRDLAKARTGRRFESYYELHDWSVDQGTAGEFWMLLFEFLGMGESRKPKKSFKSVSLNLHA